MTQGRTVKIRSGDYTVTIPKKYNVITHDVYREQKEFFDSPPPEVQELLSKFPNKPAIERLKGFYSYEIQIGAHILIFHTERSGLTPDGLKLFIESQTREQVQPQDFNVGDIHGKTLDSRIWWLKKGNCMICFTLQGRGEPTADEIADICKIIESVKFLPD